MRRLLPGWWAGSCLLAAMAASGCQFSQPCCSCCTASAGCNSPSKRTCWSDNFNWPKQANGRATAATKTDATVVAAERPARSEYLVTNAANYYAPTRSISSKVFGEKELPAAATDRDATSSSEPHYGHDANYHSLTGILDYSRIQQAWILRYVSYEEDDRYGGSVTLVAPSSEMRFKPGQTVRVEGELIDPESRHLRPAFQVQKIQAAGS